MGLSSLLSALIMAPPPIGGQNGYPADRRLELGVPPIGGQNGVSRRSAVDPQADRDPAESPLPKCRASSAPFAIRTTVPCGRSAAIGTS